MKPRKEDLQKCGIYCIINTLNGKTYVGKSINIYNRIRRHIRDCTIKNKDENRYLINSWHKYSENVFEYIVLEYLPLDEKKLKERELYWILKTNSLFKKNGYNLRLDTKTKLIVSDETRKLMSKNRKKYHIDNPNHRKKIGRKVSQFYKNNPEKRKQMSETMKEIKNKINKFFQFSREGVFIKEWQTIEDIIKVNPNYKWQNIYAVCNGYKPTYMNYKWRKVPKNEDIVNYTLKNVLKK